MSPKTIEAVEYKEIKSKYMSGRGTGLLKITHGNNIVFTKYNYPILGLRIYSEQYCCFGTYSESI